MKVESYLVPFLHSTFVNSLSFAIRLSDPISETGLTHSQVTNSAVQYPRDLALRSLTALKNKSDCHSDSTIVLYSQNSQKTVNKDMSTVYATCVSPYASASTTYVSLSTNTILANAYVPKIEPASMSTPDLARYVYFRSYFKQAIPTFDLDGAHANHSAQVGTLADKSQIIETNAMNARYIFDRNQTEHELREYVKDMAGFQSPQFEDGLTNISSKSKNTSKAIHIAGPYDLDHMKSHISHESLKFLVRVAKYAQISYCVESLEDIEYPFWCRIGCTQFPYTKLLLQWYEFWTQRESPIAGYMAVDYTDREILVLFRGVAMPSDLFVQTDLRQVDFVPSNLTMSEIDWKSKYGKICKGCKIHGGLYRSYLNTMKYVSGFVEDALDNHPGFKVVFAGHNIGGAMATIVGLDYRLRGLDVHVVSLGSPKVFNLELSEFFENQFELDKRTHNFQQRGPQSLRHYRVTRRTDPVPHWPYMRDYQHLLGEVYIASELIGHPRENVIFHCFGRNAKSCSFGDMMDLDALLFVWDTHYHYFVQLAGCALIHSFFFIKYLRPIANPDDPYS